MVPFQLLRNGDSDLRQKTNVFCLNCSFQERRFTHTYAHAHTRAHSHCTGQPQFRHVWELEDQRRKRKMRRRNRGMEWRMEGGGAARGADKTDEKCREEFGAFLRPGLILRWCLGVSCFLLCMCGRVCGKYKPFHKSVCYYAYKCGCCLCVCVCVTFD